MADQDALFETSLISTESHQSAPPGYSVRPLHRSDFSRGFFETLAVLTWVGNPTQKDFEEHFDWLKTKGSEWFYNVVLEHEGKVVGTGVLIVERKLIHNFGKGGHIEDISIATEHQGKGLGKLLINALSSVAEAVGCYRCTLDCAPRNEGFYEKCGYHKGGTEMSRYFEEFKNDYERG